MPSSCSKVVRKQQPATLAQPVKAQRRDKPLAAPSPVISDGATTEADLCKWANWFARFHTDPMELYVPIALRTVDCNVSVTHAELSEPPRRLRCVREVAKFNGVAGVEWKLITWVPGLPGAQFQSCGSLDTALTLLDSPPEPVFFRSDKDPLPPTP